MNSLYIIIYFVYINIQNWNLTDKTKNWLDFLCYADDKGLRILAVEPSTYYSLEKKRLKNESNKEERKETEENSEDKAEEGQSKDLKEGDIICFVFVNINIIMYFICFIWILSLNFWTVL